MKVLKTEDIKEEATDRDVLSTIKVGPGIEYIEQMSVKNDIISSNKVGSKTIKYETNREEKISSYDTEICIKAEINDIKYELDIEEATDRDALSAVEVNPDIEYMEQKTIRSDISSNEVSWKTIKDETNIAEEAITLYDTEIGIKTEINYTKNELDIEEHKLSYNHLKSTNINDYKIEHGNQHMEHTSTKCNTLKIHVASKNGYNKLYQPYKCKYKTEAREDDVEHCKGQHNEIAKWYQCQYCNFKTKFQGNFSRHHSLKHNGPAEFFYCASCDFKTKCKRYLSPHLKLKHVNSAEIFHCEFCDYKTKCKRYLLKHQRIHNDRAEIFHCELCNFRTKYREYLSRHRRLKHDDSVQIFNCEMCDFKTKRKDHLSQCHSLKHDESAEILHCELCDFKTKCNLYLLRHHRRMHSGEIFHCELCDFQTKHKRSLLQHQKTKHDSSYKMCHLCPYKTKCNKSLAEHLAKTHGKNIQCFQCSICTSSFTKKNCLVRHLKTKHSANIFECYSCGFCTKYKQSLDGHMRRRHKN